MYRKKLVQDSEMNDWAVYVALVHEHLGYVVALGVVIVRMKTIGRSPILSDNEVPHANITKYRPTIPIFL